MADNLEGVAAMFHVTAADVVLEMLKRDYQYPEDQFNRVCAQMRKAQTWTPFLSETYRNFHDRGRVLKKQDEPNSPGYRERLVFERGDFAIHELWRFVDIFITYLERTLLFPEMDPEAQGVINDLLARLNQPLDWDMP